MSEEGRALGVCYGLVRRSARQAGQSKAELLVSIMDWFGGVPDKLTREKAELSVCFMDWLGGVPVTDWLGGVPDNLAGVRQSSWCVLWTG